MPDLTVTERLALAPVLITDAGAGALSELITGMVHSTVTQWVLSMSAGMKF